MTVNVKTNNNTKALVEPDNISNPNLLINPDFKINQRGQNSYSSTKDNYTVDRWKLYNSTLTVNSDKTITLKNITHGTMGTVSQPLENIVDTPCVISAYVVDFSGECYILSADSVGDKVTKKRINNSKLQRMQEGFYWC